MSAQENVSELPRRRGRPPSTRAQDAIRVAASRLFAEDGFTGTSIRDIAAAAGVDPAIVIRHFQSKESLFLETLSVDEGFRGITDGPLEQLGRSILDRLVTDATPEQIKVFAALMGASDRAEVRAYLERSTELHIIQPLAARLGGRNAELRARLVAAQITGLLVNLRVAHHTHLREAPTDLVVDLYARALQSLISE